jgi:glutaryl-CoA dehydrogenase
VSTTDATPPAAVRPDDLLDLDSLLSDEERAWRDRVRSFADERIRPHVVGWYEAGGFPPELAGLYGELGVLGMHLDGDGLPGASAVEYGLACMELEAVDSGLRTFASTQGSLSMTAIHHFGSEEQRGEWLPRLAAGEALAAFALTEPEAGSDPAAMATSARRAGGDWVLDGSKRWIGMAGQADVLVVWARTDDGVRGFLVPHDADGISTREITGKLSMRASSQGEIELAACRLPDDAMLPEARGLRAPFTCLGEARLGIVWGSMGAARDSYEAALAYARRREVFGKPIAGFQLTQQKLVEMAIAVNTGSLLALHLGRMKDAGRLRPEQISFGKLNNVRAALAVAREARTVLGGNGVTLEHSPMRHASNLESVLTYEGTGEMHTLILGQAITGESALR